MATIKITQKRSGIGHKPEQRRTLRTLGLRKIGHSVVRPDTPELRGMIASIKHLVETEEAS
jgi:large subunit ribosomal protein L30